MKFMRITVGYTNWEDILTELEKAPVTDYIIDYKENWRSHEKRMNAGRFQKQF
jgi:hypothetical protein